MKLTKPMLEVLGKADIEAGEINNVPYSTYHGLVARGLAGSFGLEVDSHGRTIFHSSVTRNGLPSFDRVKLTAEGIKAARTLLEPTV